MEFFLKVAQFCEKTVSAFVSLNNMECVTLANQNNILDFICLLIARQLTTVRMTGAVFYLILSKILKALQLYLRQ